MQTKRSWNLIKIPRKKECINEIIDKVMSDLDTIHLIKKFKIPIIRPVGFTMEFEYLLVRKSHLLKRARRVPVGVYSWHRIVELIYA